jgi:hypothetical protein
MTTYYIGMNGSDDPSNPGTDIRHPFATFKPLMDRQIPLAAGHSVLFRGGDVFNNVPNVYPFDRTFKPVISGTGGTQTMPITIGSYQDPDTLNPNPAILYFKAPGGQPPIAGFEIDNAGGFTVTNLMLISLDSAAPGISTAPGVLFQHGGGTDYSYNKVLNVTVANFINGGGVAFLAGPTYNTGRYVNTQLDSLTIYGCLFGVYASNLTGVVNYQEFYNTFYLTNSNIHDNPGKSDSDMTSPSGHGILMYGGNKVLIDSNTFKRNGTQGSRVNHGGSYAVNLYTTQNGLVQRNDIESQRQTAGDSFSGDGGGIECNAGCNNVVIQFNFVFDCWGAPIVVTDDSGLTTQNIVARYNIFSANGTNPNLAPGRNGVQQIFILLQHVGPGLQVTLTNLFFYNNSVIGPSSGIGQRGMVYLGRSPNVTAGTISNVYIRNNMIYITATSSIAWLAQADDLSFISGVYCQQNSWYSASSDPHFMWGGDYTGSDTGAALAAWRATGQEKIAGADSGISQPPLPVNAGIYYSPASYKLQNTSPCINMGLNLFVATTGVPATPYNWDPFGFGYSGLPIGSPQDLFGNPVPRASPAKYDIGADQFVVSV